MSEEVQPGVIEKQKQLLSTESAEKIVQKLFDYYEIELDDIDDDKAREPMEKGWSRLVKAARYGRLRIELENGIAVTQITKDGKTEIKYSEISGKAKTQMAGKKEDDFYGKIYALMGSLSGHGETAMGQLKGVDGSLMEVLGMVFLSV